MWKRGSGTIRAHSSYWQDIKKQGSLRSGIIKISFAGAGKITRSSIVRRNWFCRHEGNLIYQGSPVCQNFGNEHFYYTSCVMNCVYDCAYCYLKGMYPSANLVVFVNLEDIFAAVERMLETQTMYLCVSYDTDLPALEQATGYVRAWSRFAAKHPQRLTIEIRTKCANKQIFENQEPLSNVIYAFTLSPQAVVERFEQGTPSLKARTDCAAAAVNAGFPVRLCFDPMIYVRKWQQAYQEMLEQVFAAVPAQKLTDVSVGSFRMPQDYLKKCAANSQIVRRHGFRTSWRTDTIIIRTR